MISDPATRSIILPIVSLFYFALRYVFNLLAICIAIFYACSTRVSNELGAGHPQSARLAVRVVLVLVVVEGLIMGSAVIMFRKKWGEIYSTETQVIGYVASMMPIIAI